MWKSYICSALLFFGLVFCASALGSTLTSVHSKTTTNSDLEFFLSDITHGSSLAFGICQYYNPDSGRWGVGGTPFNRAKLFAYSVKNKAHKDILHYNRRELRDITTNICQAYSTL